MDDKILSIIIRARNDTAAAFEKVRLEMDGLDSKSTSLTTHTNELGKSFNDTSKFSNIMATNIGPLPNLYVALGVAAAVAETSVAALGIVSAATFAVMGGVLTAAAAGVVALTLSMSSASSQIKNEFSAAFSSIKTTFNKTMAPLMPQMQKLATNTINGMEQAIQNFMPAVTNLINTMMPVMDNLTSRLGGLGTFMAGQANIIVNAFGSVRSYFTGPMMQGLGTLINGFDTLIADLIKMGAPVIGPLLTVLGQLMTTLGNRLLAIFKQNSEAIVEITTGFAKLLSGLVLLIPDIIQLGVWLFNGAKIIIATVKPAFDALINTVTTFWDKNKSFLIPVLKALGIFLVGTLVVALNLVFDSFNILIHIIGDVIQWIKNIIEWVKDATGWISNLGSTIGRIFGGIVGAVRAGVSGVYSAIVGPFQQAWNDVSGIVTKIEHAVESISGAAGKIGGGVLHDINPLNWFASGTNYAPGGLAIVGEKGPELVNLPRGSQVISNSETQQLMAGTTFNMYGSINLGSADAVDRFFQRLNLQKEMGALGVGV